MPMRARTLQKVQKVPGAVLYTVGDPTGGDRPTNRYPGKGVMMGGMSCPKRPRKATP